jgi:hypothetical protein
LQPKTFRVLAWLLSLTGALALLIILSASLVLWQPETVRPLLEQAITPDGGSAKYGKMEISLSPPRITIENLQTSHPLKPTIQIDKLVVDLAPEGIWGDDPWIKSVTTDGIQVEIRSDGAKSSTPVDLSRLSLLLAIGKADVRNASLSMLGEQGSLNLAISKLAIEPQEKGKRSLSLACRASWSEPGGAQLAWAELKGNGSLDLSPALALDLALAQGGLAFAELHGPLSGLVRLNLNQRRLRITDLSLAVGKGAGSLTPAKLELEAQSDLDGGNARLKLHELKLSENFIASAEFKGSLKNKLSGELIAHGRASFDQISVQNIKLSTKLSGTYAAPRLEDMAIKLPKGALSWQDKIMPLGELRVSGLASLQDQNRFKLDDLKIEAQSLGTLMATLSFSGSELRKASIQGNSLQADRLLALAQSMTGFPAKGWQAEGKLRLAAKLGHEEPGQWNATLISQDLGFSSADGTVLAGQLKGQLAASGAIESKPTIHTQLKLSSGQALYGTVFLDFAQAPLELGNQAYIASIDSLRGIKFKGSLKGYGRFSGNGDLALVGGALQHRGSLVLSNLDVNKLFNTFVRDPLSVSQPDLAGWRVNGKASLEVSGTGKGVQANMKGRLILDEIELRTNLDASLARLDLNLPFTYNLNGRAPQKPDRPGRKSWGKLSIKGLNTPALQLQSLKIPVAVTPNRLWTVGAINVPLAGGNAQITQLQVDEPLSPQFIARFAAQLDGINLAQLAGPALPLSGTLDGRLAQISLTSQRLKAKGSLEGTVFGGSLAIRSIGVDLPFNPGREIKANLKARRVHLEPLSQALKVGRVTGRLDADLKNLRLAYGQPVAFQLKVESVETPGVDQQVSLRAVNSISLLGTGAGLSGMGLGLFASFFKEFPYDKIAFSCELKNDVFRVRGLIHEDGVEYLVKRPLLMGINVINRNPDNRISFSDMLERLQRVQQDNAPRGSESKEKEER